jgi:hypothetical protein
MSILMMPQTNPVKFVLFAIRQDDIAAKLSDSGPIYSWHHLPGLSLAQGRQPIHVEQLRAPASPDVGEVRDFTIDVKNLEMSMASARKR